VARVAPHAADLLPRVEAGTILLARMIVVTATGSATVTMIATDERPATDLAVLIEG
jgi:hypothetical protein